MRTLTAGILTLLLLPGAAAAQGGLGVRGAGGGGGGDGMIGTGGTGSLPERNPGEVRITRLRAARGLSVPAVRRVLARYMSQWRYCYDVARNAGNFEGGFVLSFDVAADGRVASSSASEASFHPERDPTPCMLQAVRRWTFPAPRGGTTVRVDCTLELSLPPRHRSR